MAEFFFQKEKWLRDNQLSLNIEKMQPGVGLLGIERHTKALTARGVFFAGWRLYNSLPREIQVAGPTGFKSAVYKFIKEKIDI